MRCFQEASTIIRARPYQETPRRDASSSTSIGSGSLRANEGLTRGVQRRAEVSGAALNQPSTLFQIVVQSSAGAYRAVRKWLSFVVAIRTLPRPWRKRIGLTSFSGRP
jgi:hypothetical protein